MAIKISNTTVIDDSRNWTGNAISGANLEYGGSENFTSASTNLTLTSTSPQFVKVSYAYEQVLLPDPSLIPGGFERFVVYNNVSSNFYVTDYAGVKNLLKPTQFAICTAIGNAWKITTSTDDGESIYKGPWTKLNNGVVDPNAVSCAGLDSSKAVVVYNRTTPSNIYQVSVVSVGTDNIVSEGTPLTLTTYSNPILPKLTTIDSTRVFALYVEGGTNTLKLAVLSVSGTTITSSTPVVVTTTTAAGDLYDVQLITPTKAVVVYYDTSAGFNVGRTVDISGTTLTLNSAQNIVSGANNVNSLLILSSTRAVLYHTSSNTVIYLFSISGDTLTYNSQLSNIDVTNGAPIKRIIKLSSSPNSLVHKLVAVYAASNESYKMRCRVIYINDTTFSVGDTRIIGDETLQYSLSRSAFTLTQNKFMVILKNRYNTNTEQTNYSLHLFDVIEDITNSGPVESHITILKSRSREISSFNGAVSQKRYQMFEKSNQISSSISDNPVFCNLATNKFMLFGIPSSIGLLASYIEFNPSNTD